jgi:hypothetical protein
MEEALPKTLPADRAGVQTDSANFVPVNCCRCVRSTVTIIPQGQLFDSGRKVFVIAQGLKKATQAIGGLVATDVLESQWLDKIVRIRLVWPGASLV